MIATIQDKCDIQCYLILRPSCLPRILGALEMGGSVGWLIILSPTPARRQLSQRYRVP